MIVEVGIPDLQEIVELNKQIFTGSYYPERYSIEQYRERLEGKDHIILAAKVDGCIVADAVAYTREAVRGRQMYIWVVGVHQSHQRQGLGSGLLRAVEGEAMRRDIHICTANTYVNSVDMPDQLSLNIALQNFIRTAHQGVMLFHANGYKPVGATLASRRPTIDTLAFKKIIP